MSSEEWMIDMYKDFIKVCGFQFPMVHNLRSITQNGFLHKVLALICVPLCMIKYRCFAKEKWEKDIAVVAIAKNEGSYLKEWSEFYRCQVVSNIILYDN